MFAYQNISVFIPVSHPVAEHAARPQDALRLASLLRPYLLR
jgi:hypothetical protein